MKYVVYPENGGFHIVESRVGGFDAARLYLENIMGVSASSPAMVKAHYRPRPTPRLRMWYQNFAFVVVPFHEF